ncbi:MAG: hypothetical protein IJT62_04220 [Oscillospiraceae bacterium]|nr:hypothetical protein [Oscillospiraceae bacterium]
MENVVRKYAKDLQTGDKINSSNSGLLTVEKVKRIPHTEKCSVKFLGCVPVIMPSHLVIENVYTEV